MYSSLYWRFIVTPHYESNALTSAPSQTADPKQVGDSSNLRIITFLGSNFRTSSCRSCRRPWILQDLLSTVAASISMPRKMSLAWRERSESWWMMLVKVWQQTSSRDENSTGPRSLRLPASSPRIHTSLADNRLTRRGSTTLWLKGMFLSHSKNSGETEKRNTAALKPTLSSRGSRCSIILRSRHIVVFQSVGTLCSWSLRTLLPRVFSNSSSRSREENKGKCNERPGEILQTTCGYWNRSQRVRSVTCLHS